MRARDLELVNVGAGVVRSCTNRGAFVTLQNQGDEGLRCHVPAHVMDEWNAALCEERHPYEFAELFVQRWFARKKGLVRQ